MQAKLDFNEGLAAHLRIKAYAGVVDPEYARKSFVFQAVASRKFKASTVGVSGLLDVIKT